MAGFWRPPPGGARGQMPPPPPPGGARGQMPPPPRYATAIQYNTRNKNKLRSAIGRHKFIYKNVCYISVHIWNNITDKIDTDTSLLTFKKQLKILLFTDEITIP